MARLEKRHGFRGTAEQSPIGCCSSDLRDICAHSGSGLPKTWENDVSQTNEALEATATAVTYSIHDIVDFATGGEDVAISRIVHGDSAVTTYFGEFEEFIRGKKPAVAGKTLKAWSSFSPVMNKCRKAHAKGAVVAHNDWWLALVEYLAVRLMGTELNEARAVFAMAITVPQRQQARIDELETEIASLKEGQRSRSPVTASR